jgi:molybdate transport repressor ModE-like protein
MRLSNDELYSLRLRLDPKLRIVLQKHGVRILDDKDAEILLAIQKTNSLTTAAKRTELSPKGMWKRVRQLEEGLSGQVLETVSGGRKGGASKLTLLGEGVLQDYLILAARVDDFLENKAADPPDLTILGSHCPALELLTAFIKKRHRGVAIKTLYIGSFKGLMAMKAGLCDVAGIHILDEKTGTYNLQALNGLGLAHAAILVRGYRRVQGLIVEKGNPKSIKGLEDVLRDDVVFVNRNEGSGTKYLLELKLQELVQERGLGDAGKLIPKIRRYGLEATSHTELALTISQGRANVGFGLQCVAAKYGLGFIPLAHESYDFAIRREKSEDKSIGVLLRELRSKDFHRLSAARLGSGIEFTPETGTLVTR